MRRRLLHAVVAVAALIVLVAGCGGGGSGTTPPDGTNGVATGQIVTGGASPTNYRITLDGAAVPVAIQEDGNFSIPNVPPGEHLLRVVSPDGMSGGQTQFTMTAGGTQAVGPIQTDRGGQIVGIVNKLDGAAFTPLAGVEVIARSDLMWILQGDGSTTIRPTDASETSPLIYPPPDERNTETFTAQTEDDGSYTMKAVPPGSYLVTVAVAGLTTGEAFVYVEAGHTAVADFTLEPVVAAGVGKVEGTVRGLDADGASLPLEGAVVEVYPDRGWQPPPTDPIEVPPGISFPGTEVLSSLQAQSDGDSGTGVSVDMPDIIWQVFTTLTDSQGHYSLNVPSGYSQVSAWAWGFLADGRRVVVQPEQTTPADFELQPAPEIPIIEREPDGTTRSS